ncbi:hypothetical protein PHAMO_270013 [Magnetospirillum molischianum DSM 120]|uniref:Uncharacterized protein n=1 Tax=Magnetospirillum molischianum DSM 120 TaxID=1150626 RepID=H8FS34_MAGML|nr:hypothetical protein PHAMO_270013 [Magnetospirillum molischianum DSM 120]
MEAPKTDLPEHLPRPKILQILGPRLITGASDDDPSGIATYSQVDHPDRRESGAIPQPQRRGTTGARQHLARHKREPLMPHDGLCIITGKRCHESA